jgi:hypothetical protein
MGARISVVLAFVEALIQLLGHGLLDPLCGQDAHPEGGKAECSDQYESEQHRGFIHRQRHFFGVAACVSTKVQITHKERTPGSHWSVDFQFDDTVKLSVMHSDSIEAAFQHLEWLQLVRRDKGVFYAREKQWRATDSGVEPEAFHRARVVKIVTNLPG